MSLSLPTGPAPFGETAFAVLFARARRHTRLVRVLRLVLPVCAVGLVALLAVLPLLRLSAVPIAVGTIAPVEMSENAVTMQSAKLTGFNHGGKPYEVTAERATQGLDGQLTVRLTGLAARLGLDQGGTAKLVSAEGLYRTAERSLRFDRGVELDTTAGDRAVLQNAEVDLERGTIVSDRPVRLQFGSATLVADRLSLADSGRSVVFDGGVVMVLQPGSAAPAGTP